MIFSLLMLKLKNHFIEIGKNNSLNFQLTARFFFFGTIARENSKRKRKTFLPFAEAINEFPFFIFFFTENSNIFSFKKFLTEKIWKSILKYQKKNFYQAGSFVFFNPLFLFHILISNENTAAAFRPQSKVKSLQAIKRRKCKSSRTNDKNLILS